MKKLIVILVMLLKCALSLNAMSYEQARRQALFLTDNLILPKISMRLLMKSILII